MADVKICPKCGKEYPSYFAGCAKCGVTFDLCTNADAKPMTEKELEKFTKPVTITNPVVTKMPTTDNTTHTESKKTVYIGYNSVAGLLKVIAIITYVGAFILGIVFGKDNWGDFYFGVALIYWAAGFVSGSMFLGFAEIVRLLHEINQKT